VLVLVIVLLLVIVIVIVIVRLLRRNARDPRHFAAQFAA
jgi:hypothetical protein